MTYSSAFLLVATAAVLAVSNNNVVNVVSALELTSDNFADVTAGKTVFIKFYAPWCGHCKAMADDWKQLEADFEGHEIALIGSVDCTSDKGDSICEEFSIDGFPTVAWGDSSSPETYEGGRDYASLKAFADQFVTKPVCSVFRLEVCSSEEKAQIEAIDAKTDQELLDQAETISKLAKKEEKIFDKAVDAIQEQYETLTKEFNDKLESIKTEHNFKYYEQIMKKRAIKNPFKNGDDMDDDDDDDDDDDMKGEL